MKRLDFTKMGSFVQNLLGAVLGIIVAFLLSLPWGVGYAIDWVTNLVLLTVVIQVGNDFVLKLKSAKHLICWQYVVGLVAIILSDWAFMATSHQTENTPFFIWLAITAAATTITAIWWNLAVKKAYAKRLAAITE
jgi:hypothetical protein